MKALEAAELRAVIAAQRARGVENWGIASRDCAPASYWSALLKVLVLAIPAREGSTRRIKGYSVVGRLRYYSA